MFDKRVVGFIVGFACILFFTISYFDGLSGDLLFFRVAVKAATTGP